MGEFAHCISQGNIMQSVIKKFVILILAATVISENVSDGECPNDVLVDTKCSSSTCVLPACACSGTEPKVDLSERPQIVYLTFDEAMTQLFDDDYYTELFMADVNGDYKYTNPNGCPIRATFFVTALSNDFHVTHKYWRHHHEIAAHSITKRTNTTYWRTLDTQGWTNEMQGIREMISKFAHIDQSEIMGIRAPFLQGGGDEMFMMMQEQGFKYDASAPSQAFGYNHLNHGRYPYTFDYKNDMDCQVEPCPHCTFPGIWSQPLLDFDDGRDNPALPGHGYPCAMTDACQVPGSTPEDIYDMLMKNFQKSYTGATRAPIGLYLHTAWFLGGYSFHYDGYKMFLDEIMKLPDVWIVPIRDGIEYFQNGTLTNQQLMDNAFAPFNCSPDPEPEDCENQFCEYHVNNFDIPEQDVRMAVCEFRCPPEFPWLGNPLGE